MQVASILDLLPSEDTVRGDFPTRLVTPFQTVCWFLFPFQTLVRCVLRISSGCPPQKTHSPDNLLLTGSLFPLFSPNTLRSQSKDQRCDAQLSSSLHSSSWGSSWPSFFPCAVLTKSHSCSAASSPFCANARLQRHYRLPFSSVSSVFNFLVQLSSTLQLPPLWSNPNSPAACLSVYLHVYSFVFVDMCVYFPLPAFPHYLHKDKC